MSANTTTLTPKQREAIYEAWIAALRSGLYKQGRKYLESDGKFCCLGVLCHVLHQRPELGIEMDRFVLPDGTAVYSTPTSPRYRNNVPDSSAYELGLSTRMPSAAHRVVEVVLADLNDVDGASFAEIAQLIEGSVMPLLRTEGILPSAQHEAPEGAITPEKDHETHENTEQRDEARVMADKLTTELAACDVARPSTPVGWSDTDWIKHLQDQEPHPLAGLHINQGSMNAAADAYEAEYNAAQEARRAEHDAEMRADAFGPKHG